MNYVLPFGQGKIVLMSPYIFVFLVTLAVDTSTTSFGFGECV